MQVEISRSENQQMVRQLKLKIYPYQDNEEIKYNFTALVDTQPQKKNHALYQKKKPTLIFDHHFSISLPTPNSKEYFSHIDTQISSSASILMHYFLYFKIPITENIANAYCYAILSETNNFKRNFFQKEMSIYKQIYTYANPLKIASIENVEKEEDYFLTFKKALNKYYLKNNKLICCLGNVTNSRIVAEVADFFLKKKEVHLIIVTALNTTNKNITHFSLRAKNSTLHIGKSLAKIKNEKLFCGGHKEIAAGIFYDTEKKLLALLNSFL